MVLWYRTVYIQDFVQHGSSTNLVQPLQYMFYCSLVQIYKIAVTATQRNFWLRVRHARPIAT